MTETQERFLRSVLTRVPLDDIVEMHLFPPIRRGTMETGVAVIATLLPPVPLVVVESEDALAIDQPAIADDAMTTEGEADAVAPTGVTLAQDEMVEGALGEDTAPVMPDDVVIADDEDSPYADEPMASADADDTDVTPDEHPEMQLVTDDAAGDGAADAPAVPAPRLRILTAMYRHTIKGIDRGKWIVDVQEEADAPLAAVEAVLRGVRQRSTEPADPELVSPDALAALLEPTRVAPAA